ncbi:AfsR/SARP family transcriptional regulator [Nocardia sp. NBC_01327]|uniref:AfsR/SARP family transcriptional regulator n=1 Tax=Nocardia sp. NBC_01327 TaxID=2903593 RepID=UPI002E1431A2|nr:winged helix-turn-helix domain-containing protein [Nocardia sp. NBC_01327]
MEFLILGPLVVRSGEGEVAISAPRQRIVLTTLLLNPNKIISVDRIAQFVWDDPLPPSAAATVRTYVMRLRRALGPFGVERIQTRAPGYRIQIHDDDTDLGRFLSHRRAAKTLAESGQLAGAVEELDRGLSLWRSDPFTDVPCTRLHESESGHLRELRLQTLGWRVDMQLELHRHAEILPELRRVVREHPLNEAFVGRLMLALFRAGQQPEALELFQRVRDDLIGQFGMEPGSELREMQARILRGEDGSVITIAPPPNSDPPAAGAEIPLPAQLPPRVRDFIGRDSESHELTELLITRSDPRQAAAAGIVTGAAGIGKTSLLLRVAHAVADEFPDGQLYASLIGPDGSSVDPGALALRFLTSLGVPRAAIPDSDTSRLALYRSVVAQRRVLIVLDDVCDASQARPLLPAGGDSRSLVGSRRRLADLDGSVTIALAPLDEQIAMDLLAGIIGKERVDNEIESARSVVQACSGLPLALRIIGLRLLNRPNRRLDDTARRLADPQRILNELQVGDLSIRAPLDRWYRALGHRPKDGDELRKAFRWLGMISSRHIRPHTIAVLLECSENRAEDLLEELAEVHVLRGPNRGHYTIDRLSWAFARERLYQEELSGYYIAALRRLSQHGYPTDVPFGPPERLLS